MERLTVNHRARLLAGLILAAGLGACQPSRDPARAEPAADAQGWRRPPLVASVRVEGRSVVVAGQAGPGARVVLRGDGDQAYAASADGEGRFSIRLPATDQPLMLRPEIQIGQEAVEAPEQLVILNGGQGPSALLRIGRASRRLDRAPALGAIDSDGQVLIVSGAAPRPPRVERDGRPLDAASSPGGWTAMAGEDAAGAAVTVEGRAFVWPGSLPPGAGARVEASAEGWRVGWPGEAGAWQTVWLPVGAR